MQHFPIFVALTDARVILSGGGEAALAKLRLLLKTEAELHVFAQSPAPEITKWAADGKLHLHLRPLTLADARGAKLIYAADEDELKDRTSAEIAQAAGVLLNIVDNLADSDFITPAIVDRDPVTIAIGTEGAAPVLARAIKADLESRLPSSLGTLARIGKSFRKAVEALPKGRPRRDFWRAYYYQTGPEAVTKGAQAVKAALHTTLAAHLAQSARATHVTFVGAGPGDPDLLTLKARKCLDEADVILHDGTVAPEIFELARREAIIVQINADQPLSTAHHLLSEHANDGAQITWLKRGDAQSCPTLSRQTGICTMLGLSHSIIPGIALPSASHTPQTDTYRKREFA
ncbi:NAD(P)-dependent oxidoreductase [Planktotalea sp.]|uniref:NAD(P)-dependent oxidoreductase n=1 Tax=Planktotalea sp. TaxID=2029877 RepID=UPI003D6C3A69